MRKIIEYKASPINEVERLIADGYHPYGNPFVTQGDHKWQAMVKYEQEEPQIIDPLGTTFIDQINEDKSDKIKELADRLIATLDDSVTGEAADFEVAAVSKAIYNDVLNIKGNIVIDKSHPVARVHGGFGENGKRAAAIIAKYKFEETNNGNERSNRSTDSTSEAAQE